MTPTNFPGANITARHPEGMAESQVKSIPALTGEIVGGDLDGSSFVVVAWKPSIQDIQKIMEGEPIYLTCLGGLPPHCMTMSLEEATFKAQ